MNAADVLSNKKWWLCPNGTCLHGGILHDIYDLEDEHPRCCVDGCDCGGN